MAATFEWNVTRLQSYGEYGFSERVKVRITWTCTGSESDEDGAASVALEHGVTKVSLEPDADFIPLNRLTEQNVLDWLWTVVRRGDVEGKLRERLKLLVIPPLVDITFIGNT